MKSMQVRRCIIPCAGLGTRLYPLTEYLPKEMLPLGPYPAIHFVLGEAIAAGMKEIIIVINGSKRIIARYARERCTEIRRSLGKRQKIDIGVVYQNTARGLGDAILKAKKHIQIP